MAEKHEYRSLFLTEFIHQIILNMPVREVPMPEPEAYPVPFIPTRSEPTPVQVERIQLPLVRRSAPQEIDIVESGLTLEGPQQIVAIREIDAQAQQPSRPLLSLATPSTPQSTNWGRITSLIANPLIDSIECVGPDQPVTIQKKGVISPSNISLTAEEIKAVIEGISKEVNTPIEENVFKAETQTFIMTAVLSEFGGSRFIVHKKVNSGARPTASGARELPQSRNR